MYIICFTSSAGDLHTEKVFEILNKDFELLALDTEQFGIEWTISLQFDDVEMSFVEIGGKKVLAKDINSVWWRKPTPVNIKYMKDEMASFVFRESNDAIYGFLWALESLGCMVVNHPFANYKASIKPLQMLNANRLGLITPSTLITNNPASAISKIGDTDCVSKGVSMSWAIEDDKTYPIFVKRISAEKIDCIEEIRRCPATIQKEIKKNKDARVVVLKDKLFYFQIESTTQVLDWRESLDNDSLHYTFYEIEGEIVNILQKYNKIFDLVFSAFDFVIDENGYMQFLESNPNGQWLWLDQKIEYRISKAFAEVLASPRGARA